VLAAVGDVLRSQLRNNIDFAARYGGEEFAVLLPNTPRVGAEAVGERLSREVSKLLAEGADEAVPPARRDGAFVVGERIRLAVEEAMVVSGKEGPPAHVTVSVGAAVYPDAASNADELVQNADKALYLAKHLGKNRVEVFVS